jgi:lipid II isoglutaminyl synthase (glutamine-hydrolysing)
VILRAKVALARAARALARRLGRSGGTTAPGRLLLQLEPEALARLGTRLEEGAVVVSATNGKTTTAGMLAAILEHAGERVVHNRAGSNMHWGVATALLDAGREDRQVGLFEVDEGWLAPVARALDARLFLLSNLFRDQLDRYGELDLVADRWAELVAERNGRSRFVLNADDPLVADLGRERTGVSYFGVDDLSQRLPGLQHAADSKRCRRCGANYRYDAVYLGHLGRYECPRCGRRRPSLDVAAERVELRGMAGSDMRIRTPDGELDVALRLPGLYNVYNALGAAAAGIELGAGLVDVKAGLEGMAAVFGRVERLRLEGVEVAILLVKNPAGANEVLRTLRLEQGPLDLWLALNDRIADGRDVSWVWDADFEVLAGHLRRVTCSGTRAEEMALRLKYAGIDAEIAVDRDLERSRDAAVAAADGTVGVYALPTYTALLELRDVLSARGVAPRWSV